MRNRPVLIVVALIVAAGIGATIWAFTRTTYDEHAANCTTALTGKTGDTPTVSEAKERVDALDNTLADMVGSGYADAAKEAADAVEAKTKEAGSRPDVCGPLSDDDYGVLLMAKVIGGLGWTGEGGEFDKLKMVESLGD